MVGGEAHHRGHREKLWLDPLQSCHVNNRTSSFQCQQWCSWFYLLIYGLQTSNLRPQTWRGGRIQRIWWNTVSSPQNVTDISHVCHVWIKMVTRHSSKHTHSGNSDSINIIYAREVAVYQRRRRKKTLQSLHPRPRLCVSAWHCKDAGRKW